MYNTGGGDGKGGHGLPLLLDNTTRKDRDSLIEQSATQSITLIEQSL